MDKIIAYLGMAVVVESVITIIADIAAENRISWKKALSILVGVIFAIAYKMDILLLAGFSEVPVVGQIATGMMLSRGSNYLYKLYSKITKPLEDTIISKDFRG